ncbi:hypothetical protein NE237_010344 [Protea cynaroides]|uniref:Uncharacterized protein n=1 Tax=Protea cynaroides TaxID=273540 RepID=A0A9Q0KZK2_9MAGN|nr:hypothetical protein NE237_010344 [Protea cynaroides]
MQIWMRAFGSACLCRFLHLLFFSLYILAFIVVVTFLDFTVCAQVLDWRSNRGFLKWTLKKFYQWLIVWIKISSLLPLIFSDLFMFGKSNSPSYLLLLFNHLVIVKESIRKKLTNWCSFFFLVDIVLPLDVCLPSQVFSSVLSISIFFTLNFLFERNFVEPLRLSFVIVCFLIIFEVLYFFHSCCLLLFFLINRCAVLWTS